jgi:hypothetical protein
MGQVLLRYQIYNTIRIRDPRLAHKNLKFESSGGVKKFPQNYISSSDIHLFRLESVGNHTQE